MAILSGFTQQAIPNQTQVLSFGPKSEDNFRLTSSFSFLGSEKAISILEGTLLLQQQSGNPQKVNVIIKPKSNKGFKLPVKYVIYRGIKTDSFLNGTDLNNATVRTSGTELINLMQQVQQQRTSGTSPVPAIPLQALFGYELNPSLGADTEMFFHSTQSPNTQLFLVESGMEIGTFASGEGGIEIILENAEFFLNIEMAKRSFLEINVSSVANNVQKRYEKEQIKHFIDPAAFYGLHCDIEGGIEYRNSSGTKLLANTKNLVYDNVISTFYTKNTVYLDIRNENGYSYNYYNNYIGTTGNTVNDSKELKIGVGSSTLNYVNYYTQTWPIHIVSGLVPSNSSSDNTINISLRLNDNSKPLLCCWNTNLSPFSSKDRQLVFCDEKKLLPIPLPAQLPEFTNPVTITVPNIPGAVGVQMPTIIRLDYAKQLNFETSLNQGFVYSDRTDYLFGPISSDVSLNVAAGVKWMNTGHKKYCDALTQGYAVSSRVESVIDNVSFSENTIIINDIITEDISEYIYLNYGGGNSNEVIINVGKFTVKDLYVNSNQTIITLHEPLPSTLVSGNVMFYNIELPILINRSENYLLAEGIDLTTSIAFVPGNSFILYGIFRSNSKKRFEITNIEVDVDGNSYIHFTGSVGNTGFGAFMNSGVVNESTVSDQTISERIAFYSFPEFYYGKAGTQDSNMINFKGGYESNSNFFLDVLAKYNPKIIIEKRSIDISLSTTIATLSYSKSVKVKDNFFFLGITKAEHSALQSAANTELSSTHIKTFKLVKSFDSNYDSNYQLYYKYYLHVSGVDINGYQKITNFKIDIYSTDALIFTSNDYAEQYVAAPPVQIATTGGTCPRCSSHQLTPEFLNEILKNAKDANNNSLGRIPTSENYKVAEYISYLNQYMLHFGINDNCLRRAHFLGQISKETKFYNYNENFNYTKDNLKKTFPNSNWQDAIQYARANQSDPAVSQANQIKIANIIYGTGNKATTLGNTPTPSGLAGDPLQDGYNYRGRGLIQLTGKANYTKFQTWYNTVREKLNLAVVNFVSNPDLLFQPQYVVLSAIYFWTNNKLNIMADKGIDDQFINAISKKINSGEADDHRVLRRKFVKSALNMLRINTECSLLNQPVTNPTAITSGGWRNPVDNPCITIHTSGGNKRPWRSAFGLVRGDQKRDFKGNPPNQAFKNANPLWAQRPHHGLDLFALPGTKVYGCIKGTVYSVGVKSGYGNTIIIKVAADTVNYFHSLRRDYDLYYQDTPEKRTHYISATEYQMNGYPAYEEKRGRETPSAEVYLLFAHLNKVYVKPGDSVTKDTHIADSGTTGVAASTRGPHLHFEIKSALTHSYTNEWSILYNPAFYVNYKDESQLTPEEKKQQNDAAKKY